MKINVSTAVSSVIYNRIKCTISFLFRPKCRLSRLSGEPIFEEKAKAAMDVLWASRHRQSNLLGNVLNINSGDWIRRDSGIGAGIDSYYEYVAKAYILLGDETYLSRWNTHYASIMKYLGQVGVQLVHVDCALL